MVAGNQKATIDLRSRYLCLACPALRPDRSSNTVFSIETNGHISELDISMSDIGNLWMNPSASLNNDLQQMLPLSPAIFFVLFALADGEKHGYLIMQEVTVLSDGKLQMGPATLYTTIQKLADQSFA
jgi:hypothetical protein